MHIVKLDKEEFGKLLKKEIFPLYGKIDGSNITLDLTNEEFAILVKEKLFPIFDSDGNLLNNLKPISSNPASDNRKLNKPRKKFKKGPVKKNSKPHKKNRRRDTKSKKSKQEKRALSRRGILSFIEFMKRK